MARGQGVDDMNSMSAHEAQGGHVTYCGKIHSISSLF